MHLAALEPGNLIVERLIKLPFLLKVLRVVVIVLARVNQLKGASPAHLLQEGIQECLRLLVPGFLPPEEALRLPSA